MRRWQLVFFLTVLAFAVRAFPVAAEPLPVFVSILPQQYFVQQIGGEHVTIRVMVAPGASPATYEPRPRQMAALSTARLYFAIGVPFEAAWLERIAAAGQDLAVVHTDRGIRKRPMAEHQHSDETSAARRESGDLHAHAHDHGSEGGLREKGARDPGGHDPIEGIPDPHIWLSPSLVKIQAAAIREALAAADPEHAAYYERNFRRFLTDLDALDQALKTIFAGREGLRFMVFHPSWGYFADAYDLEQIPVEIEGKAPKPAQLQALIEYAREHGIHAVFVQPQFSKRSAKLLADAIDGDVVVADPLAPNWADNLRAVAAKVAAALR